MGKHNRLFESIALIVFAKTLDAPVKTRIAQTEGKAVADRIYRELLEATADSIKALPCHVAYAGNASTGILNSIFVHALSFFPQTEGDLGTRMRNACLHCRTPAINRFMVIGCDCPARTEADMVCAAEKMVNGVNVVVGPVIDGGYHLIGTDLKGLAVFDAKQWGTDELMEETLRIVGEKGLTSALLPISYDIDTIEDYRKWKSER